MRGADTAQSTHRLFGTPGPPIRRFCRLQQNLRKGSALKTHDNEIHIETNEARGESTPHVVRWVLAISLALAIITMSAVWTVPAITGKADAGEYAW